MAPWDVPGDLWFTCGAARKKGHDPPCICVYGKDPLSGMIFFRFRSFRPRALEKKVEGGGIEREEMFD